MKTNGKRSATNGTPQSIIDGALSVMATQGVAGLTTKSVSERADVSTAAIHYFFNTKDNLIYSAFVFVINAVREEQLKIRLSETAPVERIRATIGVFFGDGQVSDDAVNIWPQIWVYAARDAQTRRLFKVYNSRLISNFVTDIRSLGVERARARILAFKLNAVHRGLWIDQQIAQSVSKQECQEVLNTVVDEILAEAKSRN